MNIFINHKRNNRRIAKESTTQVLVMNSITNKVGSAKKREK